MENKDLPANPINYVDLKGELIEFTGLTKREYFAGLAIQGLISSRDFTLVPYTKETPVVISELGIEIADELLKQLEK